MAPPRTPRDDLMADAEDLRPAVLAARAMKQQILVVPTSRAADQIRRAVRRRLSCSVRMMPSSVRSGARCPAGGAARRAVGASRTDEPVRQAQVDDADVPGEQALLALEPGQQRPGRLRRSAGSLTSMPLSMCRFQRRSPTQAAPRDPAPRGRARAPACRADRRRAAAPRRRPPPAAWRNGRDPASLIRWPSRSIRRKLPPCCQIAGG